MRALERAYLRIDGRAWWYVKACRWHSRQRGRACIVLCDGQEHRHYDEPSGRFQQGPGFTCRCDS